MSLDGQHRRGGAFNAELDAAMRLPTVEQRLAALNAMRNRRDVLIADLTAKIEELEAEETEEEEA